ncbi:NEAT domain-containing protein [Paenibacillus agaridevorans]|nr:NEAT domain-containing protein [Paenibacillus agaridevorans]
MTLSMRKTLVLLLAFALLLSAVHIVPVSAATAVRDGEFPISFRYVKDGTTVTSAADSFVVKDGAKLIIRNGKAIFEHQVTEANYSTFAFFGTRKEGAPKAVITDTGAGETVSGSDGYAPVVVKGAPVDGKIVIQLDITDVYTKQDILMHINDTNNIYGLPTNYNHWYNAQLELDLTGVDLSPLPGGGDNGGGDGNNPDVTLELFQARVTAGKSLHDSTTEGQIDGTYPAAARQKLIEDLALAESIVSGSPSNPNLLIAAYNIADEAIKTYESARIVVNRASLSAWIAGAEAWLATDPKDAGFAEGGKPASGTVGAAFSVNEYPTDFPDIQYEDGKLLGLSQKVRSNVEAATTLLNDPLATQSMVNAMYTNQLAAYNWSEIAKRQFAASNVDIYVLDALTPETVSQSVYAPEIGDTATVLQQAGYYESFANITFIDNPNDDIVFTPQVIAQPSLNATTGLYNKSYSSSPAKPVIAETNGNQFTYQAKIRVHNNTTPQTDMHWQGIIKLKYPMVFANNTISEVPGVTPREIFISFNAAQHKALLSQIAEAESLLESAAPGNAIGQYPQSLIDRLGDAIAFSKETGGWLAAPRPAILTASNTLNEAVEQFRGGVTQSLQFSVAHASGEEFSIMESYFQKPAVVTYVDESTRKLILTIKDSSSVPEFRIKSGNSFADAELVSEDKSANTRTVSFNLTQSSNLIEAQVRTVVPAQQYDRTHTIRLNFNNVDNSALYTLIDEAKKAHGAAVVGTAPGQYPEFAKTSFLAAIAVAGKEAVRIPSSSAQTLSAYQTLQRAYETFQASYVGGNGPGNPTNPSNPGNQGPQYPADGNYLVDFTVLKKGSESVSVMNQYVFTTALVKVTGGSKTVSFTLKQSKEITGFTLNGSSGGGSGTDSGTNTRVVTFSLSDLSGKIPGWVSIYWDLSSTIPGFIYDEQYDVDFKFNESSARSAGDQTTPPGGSGDGGLPSGLEPPGTGSGGPKPDDGKNDPDPEEEPGEEESPEEEGNGTPIIKFSDTTNHWAKSTIEQAVKLGIVNGFSDGSFRPDNIVTRGEFAVMISRALGLEGEGDGDALQDFGSIPAWAQSHVARVVTAGLIGGFEDATFRSGGQLTRAQLAVIISRAAGLKLEEDASLSFNDTESVPAWAQKEVAAAVTAGLIQGKDGNRFDPNATATRAEALTLIIRLLDHLE